MSTILAVIYVVLKKHLLHFEERLSGQKRVRPGLMLRPNTQNLQLVGDFLQKSKKKSIAFKITHKIYFLSLFKKSCLVLTTTYLLTIAKFL